MFNTGGVKIEKFIKPEKDKLYSINIKDDHLSILQPIEECPNEKLIIPKYIKKMSIGGYNPNILNYNYPPNLEELEIVMNSLFTIPTTFKFPKTIKTLSIQNFNTPLIKLPDYIETLILSDYFNKPLTKEILPRNLKRLYVGNEYNQIITEFSFPENIEWIELGRGFNHPLTELKHYHNLTTLNLDNPNYSHKISQDMFPDSLINLIIGFDFTGPINKNNLPKNLQMLNLSHSKYNQIITQNSFPESLRTLSLGYFYDQSLEGLKYYPNLTSLRIKNSIEPNFYPVNLTKLCLAVSPLKTDKLPKHLETLIITDINSPLLNIPNIKTLKFVKNTNESLQNSILPTNCKMIQMKEHTD